MSGNEHGVFVIKVENEQQCDLCGKVAELRPYGPNGECICFECGMKDIESTTKQCLRRMNGYQAGGRGHSTLN
jgi:hypothetical protein